MDDPAPFYTFSSRVFHKAEIRPTPTHFLFKRLEESGKLVRIYTQNVDGLEVKAGVSREKVVFCHGSFLDWSCVRCKAKRTLEEMGVFLTESVVGRCEGCGGLMKPDMTFFGEKVPRGVLSQFSKDKKGADLCLVLGTSLTVAPVSTFLTKLPLRCKRLLLNREAVEVPLERHELKGPCQGRAEDSSSDGSMKKNSDRLDAMTRFDVGLFGDCDDCTEVVGPLLLGKEERSSEVRLIDRGVKFRHIGASYRCVRGERVEEDRLTERERRMVVSSQLSLEEEKGVKKNKGVKKKARKGRMKQKRKLTEEHRSESKRKVKRRTKK